MYKLLIEWLRKKLDLPKIKEEFICEACEILKLENAKLWEDNKFILSQMFNNKQELNETKPRDFKPILPKRSNWNSERMRLEREDAIRNNELMKEKALKAAGQKDPPQEVQKREESQTLTAALGINKTIEELEQEFEVELPSNNQKVS